MAKAKRQITGDETTHYVSERKKRARPKPRMQPPLTPMIDVTFQLLLFFLLAMQFRVAEGQIPGTLPQKGKTEATPSPDIIEPVFIKMRPVQLPDRSIGCLFEMSGVDATIQTPEELYNYLAGRKEKLGTDEVPVVIHPREDVPWRYVLEAFNAAIKAKLKNIGFASSG